MKHDHMEWAHPVVREWFLSRFGSPTEPQIEGWPQILAGKTTLISAPTGSGKTLAAFLVCIDKLFRKAISGTLEQRTEVVYISPLKALSNDVQKNLEQPLKEIFELARQRGYDLSEVRTAVRTGDTLQAERALMLRKPPHILVTTPESLYILLTADKSRKILQEVGTVIVDEIHAVADDKRGSHLSLSLARLDALCKKKPVRIGLSATQNPIELVAQFLSGNKRSLPVVVNVGHRRKLDVEIVSLAQPLGAVASHEMWGEIYDRVTKYTETHRSILVFVNTRKLAERMAFNLAERLGEDAVAAHHGSLSRKIRLNAEHRLKTGQLKVLVATASLELGIDIGDVDLVCLMSSPRSVSGALQRIGRAGHWRGAIPKGRIFPTTRDELLECGAIVKSIQDGELDRLIIPDCPLDVLAQQIVAACSAEDWEEDKLFKLCRSAYPYRNLERETFDRILDMLTEGFEARSIKFGAYLFRDRVNGIVKGRRGARLTAITNGGAIPEVGLFAMIAEPENINVGTLDEDFAVESNGGDIILLGNTSWRVKRVEQSRSRVLVEDAHGAAPTVPFWRGEAPARTLELSHQVAEIRQIISDMLPAETQGATLTKNSAVDACLKWLNENCGFDKSAGEQAIEYILEGRGLLGAVPTQDLVIAERFFDESGGMQLVIHAPFGARINKAWGLALRKRFCRSFNIELQAAATDDGLNIALSEKHSFPLADIFHWLHPNTVRDVVQQAAFQSPLFNTRWRWDATRALALLRFRSGKKIPPQLQRMRAEDLLATVFPDAAACQDNLQGEIVFPDHPLINEVMKDVLTEALDVDGLSTILERINDGSLKCLAIDTPMPSQFSHEILNANPYAYLDDAPLEERRARAVEMRRMLPATILEEVGRLDENAIARVIDEAWPDIRDADELHDALMTFVAVPERMPEPIAAQPVEVWKLLFDELAKAKRACVAVNFGRRYWVCAERLNEFFEIFPSAHLETKIVAIKKGPVEREAARNLMVRGWLLHLGPVNAVHLAELIGMDQSDVEYALLALEGAGSILRGNFTATTNGITEWCDRRLLARIHKLTVGILRQQIQPVTAAQFMRWLTHWQRLAPNTQLSGERGLLEVLKQLQGFEIPANAWEPQILAKRVKNYDPAWLDRLCMTGAVGWGRLSPHPAMLEAQEDGAKAKRVVPTSVAPITFFVREESDWMTSRHPESIDASGLSSTAREVYTYLRMRGASFFPDIVRATTGLKSEVETALWELVTAGLVTADGFDNLRSLIDPKRRAGHGSARNSRPRNSTGRWSLLHAEGAREHQAVVEATCWMLLRRYGIVFRDLVQREELTLTWRELLITFRRLEDRGEIRGGRFVSGFLGEQFALPVAVESVRAMRKQEPNGETVTICGADPLNLIGILLPGDKVPSVSHKTLTLIDGVDKPLQAPVFRAL
jgi:ATP-dependent Lhr-like helicase